MLSYVVTLIATVIFFPEYIARSPCSSPLTFHKSYPSIYSLLGVVLRAALTARTNQPNNTPLSLYNGSVLESLWDISTTSQLIFSSSRLALVVFARCFAAVYAPITQPKNLVDVYLVEDGIAQEISDECPRSLGDLEDFDPTNIIHLMMAASRARLGREIGINELLQIYLNNTNADIPESYSLRTAPFQLEDELFG